MDIEGGGSHGKARVIPTFVKASKRTIHDIDLDISGLKSTGDIDRKIEGEVNGISPSDMLKISLYGNVPRDSERNIPYLQKKYGEVFYLVRIDDRKVESGNYDREIEYDKSLKGEFIRAVMSAGYDEEERNAVIEVGLQALLEAGER